MSPDGPILVFDGVCVLCNRSVRFVLRHDRAQCFRFAASESASGRALMTRHGIAPDVPTSVLLIEEGRAYVESSAVLRVLARLGAGWRILAVLLRCIPAPLRDRGYRFVARRRYDWFGRYQTCVIPTPQEAARFLP